ncbi:MAG: N-acetyltransferase [Planctomycetaceae bacterium]|nr:N-acetyltransferase [Planctomycetaceae bacterium]
MRIEHDQDGGRFVAYGDDGQMGEIAYEQREGDLWATHTYVDNRYRGHGVASGLLDALAEYARQEGKKIVAICSFVAGEFERDPHKYADVAR